MRGNISDDLLRECMEARRVSSITERSVLQTEKGLLLNFYAALNLIVTGLAIRCCSPMKEWSYDPA